MSIELGKSRLRRFCRQVPWLAAATGVAFAACPEARNFWVRGFGREPARVVTIGDL
jgi:hypothetical protein